MLTLRAWQWQRCPAPRPFARSLQLCVSLDPAWWCRPGYGDRGPSGLEGSILIIVDIIGIYLPQLMHWYSQNLNHWPRHLVELGCGRRGACQGIGSSSCFRPKRICKSNCSFLLVSVEWSQSQLNFLVGMMNEAVKWIWGNFPPLDQWDELSFLWVQIFERFPSECISICAK